jgi:hypothetical protein
VGLPIIGAVTEIIGKVIDRAIPDPVERGKMQIELAKLADAEFARASSERIAQAEVNKVEASSSSLFVAGWRPAVGWACVAGFSYNIMIAPAFGLGAADTVFLRDVLLGMLGINVLARSVEKIKGVSENTLNPTKHDVSAPSDVHAPTEAPVKKRKKILGVAVPPWL